MAEQNEANLLRWLGRGGFTEGEPLATVRRIIAERDAAREALDAIHHEVQTAHRYWTTPANGLRVAKIPWLTPDAANRLMRMLADAGITDPTAAKETT